MSHCTLGLSIFAVVVAELSFSKSSIQADAAQKQLSAMQKEQRPWIQVEGLSFLSSLTFSETGAALWVNLRFKNVGHDPAIGVWPYMEMAAYSTDLKQTLVEANACSEKKAGF